MRGKTMYDKLMDMGGIDMNKIAWGNIGEIRRQKRNRVIISFILTVLITVADLVIKTLIVLLIVVKTLQWLGVI